MTKGLFRLITVVSVFILTSCSNEEASRALSNSAADRQVQTKITSLENNQTVIEGELRVLVRDTEVIENSVEDFVVMAKGFIVYKLSFPSTQDLSELTPGKLIGVQGRLDGSVLHVSEILYLKDKPEQIQAQSWAPLHILTILATINGQAPQYTKENMNMKAGVVSQIFTESSNGNLIANFDKDNDGLADIYEVSFSANLDCNNYVSWVNTAASVLQTQTGVNAEDYYTVLLVPPTPQNCGGVGGVASLGNPSSGSTGQNFAVMLKLFDCSISKAECASIATHELGHNMGQHHSGNTTASEYGDQSCLMGNYGGGNINANVIHRESIGAFLAHPSAIRTVMTSSQVTLSSLNTDPASTQNPVAIKVKKPNGSNYYVSLRDDSGFESNLKSEFRKRVQVHHIQSSPNKSFLDKVLSVGQSFNDAANKIEVRVSSIDSDGRTAQILVLYDGIMPNIPPVASDQSSTIFANDPTSNIQPSYVDQDGPGPYTISITQLPQNGFVTVDQATGSIVYRPKDGKSGPDTIKWTVNDGIDDSSEATVSITLLDSTVGAQSIDGIRIVSSGCSATSSTGLSMGILMALVLVHMGLLRVKTNMSKNGVDF